jgi:predicted lipoprotein with Yx(FWY)xxD motif
VALPGPYPAVRGRSQTEEPPLLTSGKPRAGAGVRAALLGTIKRAGGARQVTYRGHPLYTFKLEHAGQTKGEGLTDFGPPFYAVSPAGAAVVK